MENAYFNLSADKREINNIRDVIKHKNNNKKLSDFWSELKYKAEILSSQEKDNMNEKFKPFFNTKYKLNEHSKIICDSFKSEIKILVDKQKEHPIKYLMNKLDELYEKYKVELEKIEYQIDSIDIMSISELAFKKKTLPTGFIRLGNKKAIIHSQVKGEINFGYDVATQEVNNIKGRYYF